MSTRIGARVLAGIAPAGAADPAAPGLEGHWRCTGTGIPVTERSFFGIGPWAQQTRREIFSAADVTRSDGRPETSFERIVETPHGTIRVEAVEGNGTLSSPTPAEWHFAGRSFDDAAPFTLTYSLDGGRCIASRRAAHPRSTTSAARASPRRPSRA